MTGTLGGPGRVSSLRELMIALRVRWGPGDPTYLVGHVHLVRHGDKFHGGGAPHTLARAARGGDRAHGPTQDDMFVAGPFAWPV